MTKNISNELNKLIINEKGEKVHAITSSLTPSQKAELDSLSNLSDDAVRKEAESDPDCEPLE